MEKLVIAGGSGFLGTNLLAAVAERYDCVVLSRRDAAPDGARGVVWDGRTAGPWAAELEDAAAVVNLTGRSIDCRDTAANRREILTSRVDSVRALAAAVRACRRPPRAWVQASALAFYGNTGAEVLAEDAPPGHGPLAEICRAWEGALAAEALPDVRKVVLRIEFVLSARAGALARLVTLARRGLGGTVGSGRQFISWIHEDDLTRVFCAAISDERLEGPVNTCGPNPVDNRTFMRTLRQTLGLPWMPPAPAFMVRLGAWLLGTNGRLAIEGRRCAPAKLAAIDFRFEHPELGAALAHLLGRCRPSRSGSE